MLNLEENRPIVPTRRLDYQPPPWWVDTVELTFDLDPAQTRVTNTMRLRRNMDAPRQPLRLHGQDVQLLHISLNGAGIACKMDGEYLLLDTIPGDLDVLELEIHSACAPAQNTRLSGLYVSQGTFFTQCEAEGFRRITYFPDRPDVMALYTVTLRADKAQYPVLLSNGNLQAQGDLPDGRHWATWCDPHKKPSYLFALVAGQLVAREQKITSRSGSEHVLQIYVRAGDLDKTEHAMRSLMASIAWDEARFNLPLDLERFMIVATSDFNMGAMENKGLNIFNTKYVLASQATATDADYAAIESVVAHEYFHNWTGNRVTCRDWFQLSLKEGLTVFRDQEFSMDMAGSASARAVKRIEDVRMLRAACRVPDHGRRVPFRFIQIRGAARDALGAAVAERGKRRNPDADAAVYAKDRERFSHAPLVIVVVAVLKPEDASIPEQERLLSAGCTCFALLQAAQALGYGGNWLTGWLAYDPEIARLLGLGEYERVVGFVHLGTPKSSIPERLRPDVETLLTQWQPDRHTRIE